MAKLYPRHPRGNATYGERRVLELLAGLDDNWYVLHHLPFLRTDGRRRPGEADFVLLHRTFGMLVMEVKDGQYRIEQRRWILMRADGTEIEEDQDPLQQAVNNRFALRNLLKEATGIRHIPIGHCVLFARGRPSVRLGFNGPEEIVLTLASLAQPTPGIRAVVDFWQLRSWNSDEDFQKALTALCPDVVIAPTLSYTVDVSALDLERLTERQIEWTTEQVDALTRISGSAQVLVVGAAGTGKTVIAQHRARSLAAEGGTVALIGQQRHLRLQLRRKPRLAGVHCGDPVDVLASVYGKEALAAFDGDELWVVAMELAEQRGRLLDHLIVDEAQSYDGDDEVLLEAMKSLVRPGGSVLLLADPYQRDSTGTWVPSGEYEKQLLTINCRNVHPIARLVARLSGAQPPRSGAEGAEPVFTESKEIEADAVATVRALLADLAADRIVLLTETIALQQSMRTAILQARLPCQLATRLGEPGILVSTVDNFRGCESEAVVYVTDRPLSDDRSLDYVAVSRACSYLHVIGPCERWDSVSYLMGGRS